VIQKMSAAHAAGNIDLHRDAPGDEEPFSD
jgi:hypothetical protein